MGVRAQVRRAAPRPGGPAGVCQFRVTCGTPSGYSGGCRGEGCTLAQREYARARRVNAGMVPRVPGGEWVNVPTTPHPVPEWSMRLDLPCLGRNALFFPRATNEAVDYGRKHWTEMLRRDPWEAARPLCTMCPVQGECLAHALVFGRTGQYGYVGGADPWERVQMLEAM